jgi:tetratricopeptide (TPR) repeat protein
LLKIVILLFFVIFTASVLPGCSIVGPAPLSTPPAVETPAKGDGLLAAGKYAEAIDAYAPVIKSSPSAAVYFSRGKAHFLSGNYVPAADDFSAALDMDSNFSEAYYYRGWAYVANGALKRATADFNSLIGLKPGMAAAYEGRQWCNANAAQWDMDSLLYLYQRFESLPGLQEGYKGASWDFVKLPQWEIALVPDPASMVKTSPGMFNVFCDLGFSFFKKAQWAAAIADLQAAYKKNPDLNQDKWNIDWARSKSREWDKVIEDNDQVARIVSGKTAAAAFSSSENTAAGWRDSALKSYAQAAAVPEGKASKVPATAVSYIKAWEQHIGLPD